MFHHLIYDGESDDFAVLRCGSGNFSIVCSGDVLTGRGFLVIFIAIQL